MKVVERKKPENDTARYYAHFVDERGYGVEEIGDGVLLGTYGNGVCEQDAIDDYARQISLKRLVAHAYDDNRKEFNVPRLKANEEKQ
jgi:hypothetical protein